MRFIIKHPNGEQKIVLRTATFKRPWYVVGIIKDPPRVVPTNEPTPNDPLLPDMVVVERAKQKFGTNISINALIALIKSRGL